MLYLHLVEQEHLLAESRTRPGPMMVSTPSVRSRRLEYERFVGTSRGTEHLTPPRVQLDDEHGVVRHQSATRPDFRGEEVCWQERRSVRSQERAPSRRPLATWWDAFGLADARDRGTRDTMPHVLQRPLNARVPPLRTVGHHPRTINCWMSCRNPGRPSLRRA